MIERAKNILKEYWGYEDFQGSQSDIIEAILEGKDTFALMPTGGGKSICYQVPGMVMDGICIVVSPLVALIQNQVDSLKEKNIKAIALTGGIPFDEINDLLDNCLYGNYKFLYLSPERLQQPLIQERIKGMNVNLVAIDEAHCISQWGNDFRPAYLECALLKDLAPKVPFLALTATATPRVVQDIIQNLTLHPVQIFRDSFSRKNIALSVVSKEDKRFQLKKLLSQSPGSGIVYVRSRKMTVQLSEFLNTNGFNSAYFHGGLSPVEKKHRLDTWLNNSIQIMIATNAFGMGVDKADVRQVIHYQIPDSLESYFQEAGRAGRDGQPAKAIFITNETDQVKARKQFLESLPSVPFLKKLYTKLNTYLQISYGELSTEVFPFSFSEFCQRYELHPNRAFQGLRILDQNSIISLSDNFKQRTTLRFVSQKQMLFQYLEKNSKYQPVVQSILRTYGGIMEHDTKVNLSLIAKKIGIKEIILHNTLKEIEKDGMVNYQSNNSDFEISFLAPREDDRTINSFAKKMKALYSAKKQNLSSVLDYLGNQRLCRSRFIMEYFGEKEKENCGKCDICNQNQKFPKKAIREEILELLKQGPLSSRKLASFIKASDEHVLLTLKDLLEEEQIKLNNKNEYDLDEH